MVTGTCETCLLFTICFEWWELDLEIIEFYRFLTGFYLDWYICWFGFCSGKGETFIELTEWDDGWRAVSLCIIWDLMTYFFYWGFMVF